MEKLQEIKEAYAKELGYKDWETCVNDQPNYKVETLMDEVALRLYSVSNCAVWKPTMCLRWYETDNYNPINDDFDKVLQQKWQSDKGEEKWEDIEVYGR